tara:strand:+ start:171 stop:476 length:306 start_codon:yes stop_codon:yes gene_type:complete
MIIIQTTIDGEQEAKNLINLLLETNRIACGTFHEIQSSYKWKEELVKDNEFEISLYTKDSLMREVIDILKERHPYELPKITVLEPVFTLPEYEKWINNSTT